MKEIVLRREKKSPLTHEELDDNFKLLDQKNTSLIRKSGRFSFNADERWITSSHAAYGTNYYPFTSGAGTDVDPNQSWARLGEIIMAGQSIKSFAILTRASHSQISDVEISLRLRTPLESNNWQNGIDAVTELAFTEIFRETSYMNSVHPDQNPFGGDMLDIHLRKYELNVPVEELSLLDLFLKPIGDLTATRFIWSSYVIELT